MNVKYSSDPSTTEYDFSHYLFARDGHIHLEIPDGVLPDFLIQAFNTINAGSSVEALALLNPANLQLIERILKQGHPGTGFICLILGMVYQKGRKMSRAAQWYERFLNIHRHRLVLNELANVCGALRQYSKAVQYRQEALGRDPEDIHIQALLATDIILSGKVQEGIQRLRKVLERDTTKAWRHSDLLWYWNYMPELDRQTFFDEHIRWARRHAPIHLAKQTHVNDPDPQRRLRIGYVSSDFRCHSAVYNFESLLDRHDREAFEVYGYGHIVHRDEVTDRLSKKFNVYRDIYGVDDEQVVSTIVQDEIDILIAMGGHTGGNRLTMFAHKPAPVQVDYGGVSTTGMTQIDYRITDEILDPPDAQRFYVEALIYIANGYVCYRPPAQAPRIRPLPAIKNGFITFGSFNNSLKVNPLVVSLWARLLNAVPEARLILKFPGGRDNALRQRYLEQFQQAQVDRSKIEIHGLMKPAEHMALYHQVDIALDTYPFNGCLTTLEGLWMGVPIISLYGDKYISRVGLTILHRLDLAYFASSTPDEYLKKAMALAHNREALATLRLSMRERMLGSPLCDAHRFTHEVETAYRSMWRRWCEQCTQKSPSSSVTSLPCRTEVH